MLNLLVKSSVRRKILGFFALNRDQRFYPGFVAREIEESPHAVGLELSHLSRGGLLKKIDQAGRTYYQWDESFPFASLLSQTIEKMRVRGDKEMTRLTCLARRERIEANLAKVVASILKYYQPEKIILFGSMAAGQIGPYSDIDLVIVKETSLPFFKRVQQLVDMLDYDVDIDFFVYTPAEFQQALQQKRFFRDEIMKKGKVLYDKVA